MNAKATLVFPLNVSDFRFQSTRDNHRHYFFLAIIFCFNSAATYIIHDFLFMGVSVGQIRHRFRLRGINQLLIHLLNTIYLRSLLNDVALTRGRLDMLNC